MSGDTEYTKQDKTLQNKWEEGEECGGRKGGRKEERKRGREEDEEMQLKVWKDMVSAYRYSSHNNITIIFHSNNNYY